jgi:von Willebrand factor type A domain
MEVSRGKGRSNAHSPAACVLFAAGLLFLLVAFAGSNGAAKALAGGSTCKSATNIEAIVDDSGSMVDSDPNRLRVQAMDLLINALAPTTALGAVEFGSSFDPASPSADVVFPVEATGPNSAAMKSALDVEIQGDAGGTDYNAAFDTARAANPGAQARIFLTDGGHNAGTYNDAHLNPVPQPQAPTYVIGFSSGLSSAEDQARLAKIASDTGGQYFPLPDSSALQSVMDQVESVLSCQTPPRQFIDALGQGQSKAHSLTIGASTNAVQITLSWTNPLDKFKLSGLRLVGAHGPIAVAPRPRKPRKLKVSEATGSTFSVLKISGLKKGTLHFRVKAASLGSGAPRATLTTQVGQKASRR